MRVIIYDVECFAHDWLVIFKDKESGHYSTVHNNNELLQALINDNCIYVGFNSKHYDQYIIKAIVNDCTPEEVKEVNDYIIGGNQGWEHSHVKGKYFEFNNVDIRDDMQIGLSLKSIEGHLGVSVQESTIPFDIDRPLTEKEIKETVSYCKHDIDTTEKILELRKDYLKTKINIGNMASIPEVKAMSMTNAKLTSALLSASKEEYDDEREYMYPDCLKTEYISNEICDFFNLMYDPDITDKDLFSGKIEFTIGDCPGIVGYGGIHAAIPNYIFEQSNNRVIINLDVASYYPNLMVKLGYTSRSIPSPDIFKNILDTRMKAKAEGDKATANALKLVTNTTYGAMLNKWNDLYDPLMGRSVCISGQLLLLELGQQIYEKISGSKIVQLNTDGVMVELEERQLNLLNDIKTEWENRTGFELEKSTITRLAQKDVNNYIEVNSDGELKVKGGYLTRGISDIGAWNINNNACIVATAITAYFVNGTPPEETVENCDDIFQFQFIAKAGSKYKEAYHVIDDKEVPVQKVNRVYATADKRYGKLYKVKAQTDASAKIESLPEHCIIDNNNELAISDIDKAYYITWAKNRINDFLGIKTEKPKRQSKKKEAMPTWECPKGCTGLDNYNGDCPDDLIGDEPCPNAIIINQTKNRRNKEMPTKASTTTSKVENVYQKLMRARLQFLESDVQKTGKNMHLSFKYFELDDIVPAVIRIFESVGLIALVNFTADVATMSIINTDSPEEIISFVAPFNQIEPIIGNTTGKQATNTMQALGSSITYMRRYLYMMALDICESDSVDGELGKGTTPETPKPKAQPPATPEQREEVKQELTKPKGNASALQIKQLKSALKQLKAKMPEKEEMIAKIAVDTQGFEVISKADCEKLLVGIAGLLEETDDEE